MKRLKYFCKRNGDELSRAACIRKVLAEVLLWAVVVATVVVWVKAYT